MGVGDIMRSTLSERLSVALYYPIGTKTGIIMRQTRRHTLTLFRRLEKSYNNLRTANRG